MKRRMLFKIGVSLIILVGIIFFFMVDVEDGQHYNRNTVNNRKRNKILAEDTIANEDLLVLEASNQHIESEFNQAINDQIDKEQTELANYLNSRRDTAVASKEVEQEFYYDNVHPQLEPLEKKTLSDERQQKYISRNTVNKQQPVVHLSVVVCENRAKEALIMLKSAVIVTTNASLLFHIFADEDRHEILKAELSSWSVELQHRINYHIYSVAYPHGTVSLSSWNKMYKPCAAQRLFLPDRLTTVDSLIYVDTDTVFLRSVDALWSHFDHFNSTQVAGLVRESEDGTAGWYNRFAKHPYYGKFGVNSGVMLMNLTRIRRTKWLSVLKADYEKYQAAITWGDQDLINIYFSKYPEQLYLLSCEWNYRTDHCMYMSNCHDAEQNGVSLLHASRRAFYSDKEPSFQALHQAFDNIVFGASQNINLLSDLKKRLKKTSKDSNCGQVSFLFLPQIYRLVGSNLPDNGVRSHEWEQKSWNVSDQSHQHTSNHQNHMNAGNVRVMKMKDLNDRRDINSHTGDRRSLRPAVGENGGTSKRAGDDFENTVEYDAEDDKKLFSVSNTT